MDTIFVNPRNFANSVQSEYKNKWIENISKASIMPM